MVATGSRLVWLTGIGAVLLMAGSSTGSAVSISQARLRGVTVLHQSCVSQPEVGEVDSLGVGGDGEGGEDGGEDE